MKKTIASFTLIIMLSLFTQLSTAGAQDQRQWNNFLYPPLPPAAPGQAREQAQPQFWYGEEAHPLWKNMPPDSLTMATVQIPGTKSFFLGSLTEGILEGMNQTAPQFSEEERDALLSGEPQDTACVMGLRYSFSEFEFRHFFKSFFNLIGAGKSHPSQKDQGFTFYVDSTSP